MALSLFTHLNARIPLTFTPVQPKIKPVLTLEQLANAQPSSEINLIDILKAKRALKEQAEAAKTTVEKQEEQAEKVIVSGESIQEKDPVIAAIEALKLDPQVKKEIKRILRTQKNQEKLDTIITNQRIMMVLLAALAAKLVVYDLYIAHKNHTAE